MPKKCEHNTPENLKGKGACDIVTEVKKRSGKPLWWCKTHAREAGMPDGGPLETCPGGWFDEVAPERQLDVDADVGELSVWGALPPTIQIGICPLESGGVHVHHRPRSGAAKDIDDSYDIVRVHRGDIVLEIENMSARAFTISAMLGLPVTALQCPKPTCQTWHVDELKFATFPHAKHQCHGCGRHFWSRTASISSPLATAFETLGISRPPEPKQVDRPKSLNSADYSGIALWPSTPAAITNVTHAEDAGIHVHAWDHNGNQVIDETYWPVILDGHQIDQTHLCTLAVQIELAHGAPIQSMPCSECGTSILSATDNWIEPRTRHACQICATVNRTRRRSFLNPLADKRH